MWLFSKKTEEKPPESVERRLKKVENQYIELVMDMELLRDKVLRKIQGKREKIEEPIEEKTEDLYSKVLLKDNGYH
jgi:hypothetical protein